MKLGVVFLFFVLITGCASIEQHKPQPMALNPVENILKPEFCHMQLSDLFAIEEASAPPLSSERRDLDHVYQRRLSLQKKIGEWFLSDPYLSRECIELSTKIQKIWRDREEKIGAILYQNKDWFVDQKVFMNSQEQLFISAQQDGEPVYSSLSDLQDGDIVFVTESSAHGIFKTTSEVVHKNSRGDIQSPSWLKAAVVRVVAVRPQQTGRRLASERQLEFEEFSPSLQPLFEWKNFKGLEKQQ